MLMIRIIFLHLPSYLKKKHIKKLLKYDNIIVDKLLMTHLLN